MARTAYPPNTDQNTRCWALVHLGDPTYGADCGRRPPPALLTEDTSRITCPECAWWAR